MQIGTGIYTYRIRKGLTQPELARRAGIAQANLCNIERGNRDINLFTLKRIAFALQTPVWRLIKDAEEKAAPVVWSREDLESLARAVLDPKIGCPLVRTGRKSLDTLRRIFVPNSKASDKAIRQAWVEALKIFSSKDLMTLHRRIHDERMRRR